MKTTSPLITLAVIVLVAAFTGSASAQTVYWDRGASNNNITNALNWTTDTLPTGGTLGIIDNSIINPATVTLNGSITNYNLRLDAGTLSLNSGRTLADTSLEVKGGNFDLGAGNTTLTLAGTTTLTIDGGTMTTSEAARLVNGTGTTVNVKSGSANTFQFFNNTGAANFTVNVSGGSLTAVRSDFKGNGSENSTVLRITGGTTSFTGTGTNVTRFFDGGRVEFGLGSGNLSFATAPVFNNTGTNSSSTARGFINFLEDSGGSLTITGYTKTDYEAWWTASGNDNRLRYNGVNTGSFDDVFLVNDATLTLVPEPSTWALLAVSLTTLAIFRRRRRH